MGGLPKGTGKEKSNGVGFQGLFYRGGWVGENSFWLEYCRCCCRQEGGGDLRYAKKAERVAKGTCWKRLTLVLYKRRFLPRAMGSFKNS